MPYPNEHACRMREPGEFEKGSFRRIAHGKLSVIIARLKGKSSTSTQAYRYPTKDWTESEARAHCKEEGGRFEPAASRSKETEEIKDFDFHNPNDNTFIKIGEE